MTFRFSGFRDGHCHPLFAGRELLGPSITGCDSIAEIQNVLRDYRAQNPDARWIDCGSYNRNLAPGGRFLAEWLDAAVSDIPVVVHADDHHTCWVNTAALEISGLTKEIPLLSSGSVDTDDAGRATGVLREWEAMNLVYIHQPSLTIEEEIESLAGAQLKLLQAGVVGVLDAWVDRGMEEIYLAAEDCDRLLLRTNLAPRINPSQWQLDLEFAEQVRTRVETLNSPRLSCKTVKFFADGVFGSGTASVLEPYEFVDESANSHGEPVWTTENLTAALLSADLRGFQLHLHAIGDGGVRTALDAIEAVIRENPQRDRRPVLAHVELIADEDLARFRELGVSVSLQPLWARPDDMLKSCAPRLGVTRLGELYRFRDLLNAGVQIGFGSDWPVSSPIPFEGIYTAVHRKLPHGNEVHHPQQRLTLTESLAAYSTGSAYQLFQEDFVDVDWVELTADPLSIPSENWHQIKATRAYVAGRLIELS